MNHRHQQRRAKAALANIKELGHKYDHILRSKLYRGLADLSFPSLMLTASRDERSSRNLDKQRYVDILLPERSFVSLTFSSHISAVLRTGLHPVASLLSDKLPSSM